MKSISKAWVVNVLVVLVVKENYTWFYTKRQLKKNIKKRKIANSLHTLYAKSQIVYQKVPQLTMGYASFSFLLS